MTIDSRTLTTNYNVADNATGAQELWLRSGFEWTPLNNVTVKNQVYYYQAKRNWLDSETYAFDNATCVPIDRDRFFVTHDQHVVGNNADLFWDSQLFGMDNRFAAQLQMSSNWITFKQDGTIRADFPRRLGRRRRSRSRDSTALFDSISATAGSTTSPDRSRTVSSSRRRSR